MIPTQPAPRRPLVAWRAPAVGTVAVAALLFAVMALWLHDSRDPTTVDDRVGTWLYLHTGTFVQQALLALTEPVLTIGIVVVVTVVAALVRRYDVALLGAIAPALALGLEDYVFKPSINRLFGLVETLSGGAVKAGYAFPSGHETGLTSVTVLLSVLVLRTNATRSTKTVFTLAMALWTVLGAAGLVRSGYHYATDTLGGILLGVVVVLGVALLIDLAFARWDRRRVSSPAAHARPRTARGA